ncbi:hypothetical protein PYCC9005_004307 [Savitreella phatthalungensis]
MSFEYSSAGRPTGLPQASGPQTSSHMPYHHQQRPHHVPRYDPSSAAAAGLPAVPPSPRSALQVLGYSPQAGSGGTTLSVHVSGLSGQDAHLVRFVFGQRRVGAFMETPSGGRGGAMVLSTQVPRFADVSWWSSKVPVYLLVVDPVTGADANSFQVGEFTFIDSPRQQQHSMPAKRPRHEHEDIPLSVDPHAHAHNPYAQQPRRPASQPVPAYGSQFGAPPSRGHMRMDTSMSASSGYGGEMPTSSGSFSSASGVGGHGHDHDGRYVADSRQHPPPPPSSTAAAPFRPPPSLSSQLAANPNYGAQHFEPTSPFGSASFSSASRGVAGSTTSSSWRSPTSAGLHVPSPASTLNRSISGPAGYGPGSDYHPHRPSTNPDEPALQRTSTIPTTHAAHRTTRTIHPHGGPSSAPASSSAPWAPANRARLEVIGDLEDMARNWSAEEFGIRRRLVQFWRKQEGNVIRINFRPVEPGSTRPPNAVIISCIYWEERQECFFTSVDAIFLLESLVGNRFVVEEKNRIRRNLEGFRPLTVSKGKHDSDSFFKLIMSFPPPKPRNIEKDVKAFPWRILTSALRKIISKYSTTGGGGNNPSTLSDPTLALAQTPTDTSSRQQLTPASTTTDMPPPPRSHPLPSPTAPLPAMRTASQDGTPNSNRSSLSIRVPPTDSASLPALDGVSGGGGGGGLSAYFAGARTPGDRRTSDGVTLPVPGSAGFGGLDFGEFMFQSPGMTPAGASGWPGSAGAGAQLPPLQVGVGAAQAGGVTSAPQGGPVPLPPVGAAKE